MNNNLGNLFFVVILVVYLDHVFFCTRYMAVLIFSKNRFLGDVLSSQIEEHLRQKGVNLCRSTRQEYICTYFYRR